jgi:hypothetical protein
VVDRLPGWDRKLGEYVRARRHMPFAWGVNDCCTFSAEWVALATGVNPFPELRQHRTAFAATRALVRHGCKDAVDIATLVLGAPMGNTLFARRGDIVAIDALPGKPCLGICLGQFCAFPAEAGLRFVQLSVVKRAWHV